MYINRSVTWSEDLHVIKSEDGGQRWWNPLYVSNTPDDTGGVCPNGYPKCDPAEEYPHAVQWATDTDVYIQYQMPNWEWNEIGDPTGPDHMNWVYVGYAGDFDWSLEPRKNIIRKLERERTRLSSVEVEKAARGAVIDDVTPDANSPIPKKYIA